MASPPAAPPLVDDKAHDAYLGHEAKPSLNGARHASHDEASNKPAAEAQADSASTLEKPLTNGSANLETRTSPVPATSESKPENGDRASMPSLDNPKSASPEPKESKSPPAGELPPSQDAVVRRPDDVEMADASPTEDKQVPEPVKVEGAEPLLAETKTLEVTMPEKSGSEAPIVETKLVETVVEEPAIEVPASAEPLVVETPVSESPAPKAEEVEAAAARTEEAKTEVSPAKESPVADTEMGNAAPEEKSTVASPKAEDSPPREVETALPTSEVELEPHSLSQLDIATTQDDTSTIEATKDVSMSDAPSFKVSREREEDAETEPAAKRAKTEPEEDKPQEPISTTNTTPGSAPAPATAPTGAQPESIEVAPRGGAAALGNGQVLSRASLNWEDTEKDAKEITPYQRREIRKVLGRIKKTKSGLHFRDSVQKLWPQLWEAYALKIERPMDLSELDRNVREPSGPYVTFGDFKRDLGLILDNTLTFNGPVHDITTAAFNATKVTWEDIVHIPEEEPPRPKALPKSKPIRESRAAATATVDSAARRQSAGPAAIPAATSDGKAKPAEKPSELRRSSTADDRPKRTVRAPKPKDIDYSTKPSRKKLKPELQFCDEVLSELMSSKHEAMNHVFMDPVDAEGLGIPTYYSVIKKPMDLHTLAKMMANGDISSLKEFDKNARLIFQNCYTFNGTPDQGNPVSLLASSFEGVYNSLMKGKDAWLSKHAKANAASSNASEQEDDDDDDADGEDAAPAADFSKEIGELENKLREEQQKLTALILDPSPNPSLVKIHQGIVQMIQSEIESKKAESQKKPEKAGKKSSKAKSKPKASGGSSRKASTAAHPKKTGGTKKPPAKKTLTASDKDEIANAINDLDYPQLDQAIDIIKRDTGQNENNDGELELDIDQLSNDALLKLWDLCSKVLPNFGKKSAPAPKAPAEANRGASKQDSKSAGKSKKNKPMSAQEQEARISQLQSLQSMYKGKGEKQGSRDPEGPETGQGHSPVADSSDESSSEEE